MSNRYSELDLAQALANNPSLRLSRQNSPSVKYYVVPRRDPAAPAMVHCEGCSVLKRATHAQERNSNPVLQDRFNRYEPHSCLSGAERESQNRKSGQGKATDGQSAPVLASVGGKEQGQKRKYRNEIVEVGNLCFDSRKEYKRYLELIVLENAGEISDLAIHPKYDFVYNGVKIGSFKPDFTYYDGTMQLIVEDVKSPITRKETSYRLRKRMMLAFHGITIRET